MILKGHLSPYFCSHFKLMSQTLELTQNSSLCDKPVLFSHET